jgi:hypothetical protein
MKFSILLSVALAAIFVAIGWNHQSRIGAARDTHRKLVAQAASLGIGSGAEESSGALSTRRDRPDREAVAKTTAVELIAFAKEMEELQKNKPGSEDAEKNQQRVLDFMERLASLDAAQIKILIADFRSDTTLSSEMRQGLIGFSVMTLANDNPRAALGIFTEASDLFPDRQMNQQILSSALGKWAKDDPDAALAWVRANTTKFPDLVTDQTKQGLIAGTAANNPKLALSLINELGLAGSENTFNESLQAISRTAVTPAQRSGMVEAIRDYVASPANDPRHKEMAESAFAQLGSQLTNDGFSAATTWISDAKLSPTELRSVINGMDHNIKGPETGKWIEWIGEKAPGKEGEDNIRQIVRQWTTNDYQAAGQWLNTAPEGPAKTTAIRSYAETVAPYEPETAAQWAETLPPGKDRDFTIRKIHGAWLNKDQNGAAAFAEKHAIK